MCEFNLTVQSSHMEWCVSRMIHSIDICMKWEQNRCAGNRANLCRPVQRRGSIHGLAPARQAFLQQLFELVWIVSVGNLVHGWIVQVFEIAHSLPLLLGWPLHSITVCVIWGWWRRLGLWWWPLLLCLGRIPITAYLAGWRLRIARGTFILFVLRLDAVHPITYAAIVWRWRWMVRHPASSLFSVLQVDLLLILILILLLLLALQLFLFLLHQASWPVLHFFPFLFFWAILLYF